jgi:ABC-type dipeptide/oligopeptide/nickel transport system permease component
MGAKYLSRKLLLLLPTVLGVATLVFLMRPLIPGDPVDFMLGESALAVDKAALRHEFHLDRPLIEQYGFFIGGLAKGDLGRSIMSGRPVTALIAERLPNTLVLALAAALIAVLVALPLGVAAAARPYSWIDNASVFFALIGVSMPNFWLGPLLILLFSIQLGWLPVSGRGGPLHLVLPALTLGLAMAGILTRLTRATMLEAVREDYIRTARAKGLPERAVFFKHALRNALIPVVTMLGLQLGALLAGSIITETIFAWPGLGRLIIQAVNARDFPLLQGCVMTIAVGYTLINLATEVVYAIIDPRIRFGP